MDCPLTTVIGWRDNGIPKWRRQAIAELANERGVPLPAEFLATRSATRSAA